MFDDEKENENWDNIDTDINISSDEPSWDDILDDAVVQDLSSEEDFGAEEEPFEEEDYIQNNSSPNYVNGQVYDVIEDDEPIIETTSQSIDTNSVSGGYVENQPQQQDMQNSYEANTYSEQEAQNYQPQTNNVPPQINNPTPIGIKQERKSSSMPVILGILVAVLFAYAGYTGYMYLKENDLIPSNKAENVKTYDNQTQNDEDLFSDFGENNQNEMNGPQGQQPQDPQAQAQQEAKPNDKVVVTVTNTGRSNPFTPTGNFSDAGYTIPKGLDIMAPPSYDEDVTPNKIVDIVVSGILYDNLKPSAIITIGGIDHFVQRGDSIDEYVVSYIGPTSVTIRTGKNTYTASIGQQFNVNDKIDGATTYVKTKTGTTRQYFTPSEKDIDE